MRKTQNAYCAMKIKYSGDSGDQITIHVGVETMISTHESIIVFNDKFVAINEIKLYIVIPNKKKHEYGVRMHEQLRRKL